jgi:hypothetical protein
MIEGRCDFLGMSMKWMMIHFYQLPQQLQLQECQFFPILLYGSIAN